MPVRPTGTLRLRVFDGARAPFPKPVVVSLFDGRQRRVHWATHKTSDIRFTIPVTDGPDDLYRIVAGADKHRDAGQVGVLVRQDTETNVDLMLLPKVRVFEFAPLTALDGVHSQLGKLVRALLRAQFNDDDQVAYERLAKQDHGEALATLLNVVSGFDGFAGTGTQTTSLAPPFSAAKHPLAFIQRINRLAPDRFFADVETGMVTWLQSDTATFGPASSLLHRGADISFKERRYEEGNVQFTFTKTADPNVLVLDSDVDLFKDSVSHLLVEVLPNDVFKPDSHTDPGRAYAFRWMSARRVKARTGLDFNPPFTVVPV